MQTRALDQKPMIFNWYGQAQKESERASRPFPVALCWWYSIGTAE